MKIKTLSLIAGVFALTLTAAPFAAKANTTLNAPLQLAQATSPHHHRGRFFEQLGLSDAQKAQIKQIHQQTREQSKQVITPDQEQAFKTAMQNRQGFKAARQAMNLTEDQKSQLKQIWQSSREQINAVLTPDQQTKLQELRQQWRANHPKRETAQ
ncbi:Spy/CpxP family protein refolding chaperone [Aetokthonos hydrillicola Thurmond2011]|uniref:Spy/CpxP family protein refolding chaperone n=1 Tax=Aetokthonos hydrillicola Thurmond2011 TaxID=2712845 RepID=A0AAP5M649_9CYAN|nr:Spy/CpxP family protein refolding chaperone [Aetokthonos hydrillicola]MBO3463781.1 P pilus assembly/Cpx signaling pathway, periplasmic inhibitor/zinc-resistance associated protein [Aetokthonos hydrillicola CCALA 1050]MBW4585264.1 Spy/CpxP family protein refolding chaperone [Aetokthonos hydrillicola CCALA 1050]MDR9896601.1 Spy/CpxP family protein refolding chaperone [Aetokthonos hydrillicola Thurmond2011]